jgi:hypothetical protein
MSFGHQAGDIGGAMVTGGKSEGGWRMGSSGFSNIRAIAGLIAVSADTAACLGGPMVTVTLHGLSATSIDEGPFPPGQGPEFAG